MSISHDPHDTSLSEAYRPYFDLGVAVDLRDLVPGYADLLARHFTSVTPENAMKPAWVQPEEGVFDFEAADMVASFADRNGQRLYGHTMTWHHQTPAWVFHHADGTALTGSAADRALLLGRAERHIGALADHFGDRMWAWEVSNEAVDEDEPDDLRRTPWRTVLGDGYLRDLFRIARDAAPGACLVLNDFETERPAKRDAYLRVVRRLLDAGVELDAVGHQMHLTLASPIEQIDESLAAFAGLGLAQVVTELDVSVSRTPGESLARVAPERLAEQAAYYARLFETFRSHARTLRCVTLWGLTDAHSWLRYWPVVRLHEAPLLFDDLLRPKDAFRQIMPPFATA